MTGVGGNGMSSTRHSGLEWGGVAGGVIGEDGGVGNVATAIGGGGAGPLSVDEVDCWGGSGAGPLSRDVFL